MVGYRISRKHERKYLRPGRGRLYQDEAEELVRHLNAVPPSTALGILADLGRHSYRGRHRIGSSMDEAAGSLMNVIASSLHGPADYGSFTSALAERLNLNEETSLRETVLKFLVRDSHPREHAWRNFLLSVMLQWAAQSLPNASRTLTTSGVIPDSVRVSSPLALLYNDDELLERVLAFRRELRRQGDPNFFDERRLHIRSYIAKGYFSEDSRMLDLKALDFLERHLVEIDREFELSKKISDFSIRVAIEIFDFWVHDKLKAAGLSYRLVLDRLTSTYRLVPPEACGRLDDPNQTELRDVEARTVLSACLIAYLTVPGIDGRIEQWVEGLGLIERLGFADVLECLFRCQACGRWVYAVHSRRNYCGDKCRYSVWMKTPKGLEKRRNASSAWRHRYSKEIRKATPDLRRRKVKE